LESGYNVGSAPTVTTDDDGETQSIKKYEDDGAQAFLEEHANHLLEPVFGPFPEAGAAERRLTVRVPGNLADRLEACSKA